MTQGVDTEPQPPEQPWVVSRAGGPQYVATHVYLPPGEADRFVSSWVETFGGTARSMGIVNVTPTPSLINSQVIISPVGTLSVFELTGPMPHPFGLERAGWRVADLNTSVNLARDLGAAVVVEPFGDPVGRHAVVQLPGGSHIQFYWVSIPLTFSPLNSIPDSRFYLSPDSVEAFLNVYLPLTEATVVADNAQKDGLAIGRPSNTFREIRIASPLGSTVLIVTDGHLPYPYGHEVVGYAVNDIEDTLTKARAAGATVLAPVVAVNGNCSAVLQFPGGYIAEVHAPDPDDTTPGL